jgi:hypothetical protein
VQDERVLVRSALRTREASIAIWRLQPQRARSGDRIQASSSHVEPSMYNLAATPGPAPGDHEKSPVKLPTEPDRPLDAPVTPQPEESPGHANAKANPDRRAQSVEDAHADGADRSSETESPQGSVPCRANSCTVSLLAAETHIKQRPPVGFFCGVPDGRARKLCDAIGT